jgi:hypothetical protein
MLTSSLVEKVAYIYLSIPVFLFFVGWLNYLAASSFVLLLIIALISFWKKASFSDAIAAGMWQWLFMLLLLFTWLYLSGIGGYVFQNWDYHSRNAVFHDLINYSWPVVYHIDQRVASQFNVPSAVFLSYYFGHWLPAALIGKLAGLRAADCFLFLWSLLGVFLAVILTSLATKLSLIKTTLLIVFFSGMDIVGVLLLCHIPGYNYPGLWPPIQHLEWWAISMQYSSFTTSLFWTYNQFIPTLLIMSLFVRSQETSRLLFILGFCFFFAPLPAIGLLPLVICHLIRHFVRCLKIRAYTLVSHFVASTFTAENIAGIAIALLAFIFYSTNLAAKFRCIQSPGPFVLYIIFIFLEGLLIWLLLLPQHRKDWAWYIAGFMLVICPFISIGANWAFMTRVTLPALYLLAVGLGSFLARHPHSNPKSAILLLLLILGSPTAIYEINRTLVRTARYYDCLFLYGEPVEQYFQNPPKTIYSFLPEFDHLSTLTADNWGSVSVPNSSGWDTKVGNLLSSRFLALFDKALVLKVK